MNRLSTEQRAQIVGCLTEGMSMRATSRITGVARNTINSLLIDLGQACSEWQDGELANLPCTRFEVDEIWSFVGMKAKQVPEERAGEYGIGDVWTWTAICADTKLVPSWWVGLRGGDDAYQFLADLKSRVNHRIQLTSDGHAPYLMVVEPLFGADMVDFAMLHKNYDRPTGIADDRRYSPAEYAGTEKKIICGDPDPALISTSYAERQNLEMRMHSRRFTRLTNGFSKKVENHAHAVALHFMAYNFGRPHGTLTKAAKRPTTPAMAAGKADHPWSNYQIAQLLDSN